MALFCRKCAEEMGFEPDITIEKFKLPIGKYCTELCEGCGRIYLENIHGIEMVYRSDDYWRNK